MKLKKFSYEIQMFSLEDPFKNLQQLPFLDLKKIDKKNCTASGV